MQGLAEYTPTQLMIILIIFIFWLSSCNVQTQQHNSIPASLVTSHPNSTAVPISPTVADDEALLIEEEPAEPPCLIYKRNSALAWSNDGRRLAYTGYNADLYAIDFANGVIVNEHNREPFALLTDYFVYEVAWHPENKSLAFVGSERRIGRAANNMIYWFDLEQNQVQLLTPLTIFRAVTDLTWSPDGQKLLFEVLPLLSPTDRRTSFDVQSQIYKIVFAEQQEVQITSLTNLSDSFTAPVWSPDGQQIAVSFTDDILESSQIVIMDADGSQQRPLVTNFLCSAQPAWSPDGQQLAFIARLADEEVTAGWRRGEWQLYMINVDGSGLKALTDHPMAVITTPMWSPDGTQIAFSLWNLSHRRTDVYVVNADGKNPIRFGTADEVPRGLAWSPDSQHLAVFAFDGTINQAHIDIIDIGSGDQARIITIPYR